MPQAAHTVPHTPSANQMIPGIPDMTVARLFIWLPAIGIVFITLWRAQATPRSAWVIHASFFGAILKSVMAVVYPGEPNPGICVRATAIHEFVFTPPTVWHKVARVPP